MNPKKTNKLCYQKGSDKGRVFDKIDKKSFIKKCEKIMTEIKIRFERR